MKTKFVLHVGLNIKDLVLPHDDVNSDFIELPEANQHPSIVYDKMKEFIYENKSSGIRFDISTNMDHVLHVFAHAVMKKILTHEQVEIKVWNESNTEIEYHTGVCEEGYFVNWPYGFMDPWNY